MRKKKDESKSQSKIFGQIVKRERKKAGLARREFAPMVGLSERYIAAIENEGQTTSYDTMQKLITTLGIDANSIFYPERAGSGSGNDMERVIRLVKRCSKKELDVVEAVVKAMSQNTGK